MEKIGEIKEAFLQGREEQWRVLIRRYEGMSARVCESSVKNMKRSWRS